MSEFNPADNNVDDVKKYVDDNPQEAQSVLDAEKARGDDARSTLVKHLEGVVESQVQAPVPAEGSAVTVAPGEVGGQNTHTFHGKEYQRTAEGGFRLVK